MLLRNVLQSSTAALCRRQKAHTMRAMPRCVRMMSDSSSNESGSDESKTTSELEMQPHVKAVFDSIVKLNMLEIAELAAALQEKFNLPDQSMMMAGAGAGAQAEEEPKEEKTIFDVKLASFDAKSKIKIIKEVRGITGLGLKEAKALVEAAPSVLKKDVKKDEADALIEKLKEIGGVVELE